MLLRTVVAPLALAATVLADAAALNEAIKTIDKNVNNLNTVLANFPGDIFSTIPILFATTTLDSSIKKAATIAKDVEPLTFDETLALADVTGNVARSAKTCIDTLISVKPKFDKLVIVSPITLGLVKGLRTSTKSLTDIVLTKVPEDLKDVATQLIAEIDAQYVRAIEAFGGDAGAKAAAIAARSLRPMRIVR